MKVRACNNNWEWVFGRGKQDYATESTAIAMNLKMKIQSWKRNCFFAQEDYIDWEEYLARKNTKDLLTNEIVATALAHDGVVSVDEVNVDYNSEDRKFKIVLTYTDTYGYEKKVNANG